MCAVHAGGAGLASIRLIMRMIPLCQRSRRASMLHRATAICWRQRTIATADAGQSLRAGQKAAWDDTPPCHGDVFHIQHQYGGLANTPSRRQACLFS
jgi:hypothetical protein